MPELSTPKGPSARRSDAKRTLGRTAAALIIGSVLIWALRLGGAFTSAASIAATTCIVAMGFRAITRAHRARPANRVYFDEDLAPSYFTGESEAARAIAAGNVREPLLLTAELLRERLAEMPELDAFLREHMKAVPPRSPESLEAGIDPDVYHIRPGLRLER